MRQPEYRAPWPQSIVLIVVLVVCYILQLIFDKKSLLLELDTHATGYHWIYQLFTFQFLHHPDNALHLFLNCLSLYFIGPPVEQALGGRKFWGLYLGSGVVGGLVQLALGGLLQWALGNQVPSFSGSVVGASAGICGLMACFSVLHWHESVQFLVAFVIPVSVRGKYLLLITVVVAVIGVLSRESGVAHGAHLGGLLGGYALSRVLLGDSWSWFQLPDLRFRRKKKLLVKTVATTGEAWKKAPPVVAEDLPPAEFISREVDPILDKISAHGIHSLTDRERKILEAARSRMGKR